MLHLSDLLEGETLEIEYKRDDVTEKGLYESIVGMANAIGGKLLIGVDNNGNVLGAEKVLKHWKTPHALQGQIMANTVPPCTTHVTFEKHIAGTVVVIQVLKAPTTTGTKTGKFLKRSLNTHGKPQRLPMTADEIVGAVSRFGIQDFSATVLIDAGIDDLDMKLAEEARKRRLSQITDLGMKELLSHNIPDLLRSQGLLRYDDDRPTIAALLMFGKESSLRSRLPNHQIDFQVFGSGAQIFKNNPLTGPIAEIFPKILQSSEFLRNSDQFIYRGSNVVIPEYPEDSRREAIANAIVHRDYTLPSSVQIQIYEGELFITNPGGFPRGVSLSKVLSVPPTPRNRALAEAMKTFGFVESSGRGVDLIFQGQARFGRPAPDYSASDGDHVSVRLIGGKANLEFCKFILAARQNATIPELLLLNAMFFRKHLTLPEAAQIVQKPDSVVLEIIKRLSEDKLVEVSPGRISRFHLKGSSNIRASKAVKPARLSNAQLVTFSNRIIMELKQRSPNALSDIADSVGLSPSQTRRLLHRLEKESLVHLTSARKWSITEEKL